MKNIKTNKILMWILLVIGIIYMFIGAGAYFGGSITAHIDSSSTFIKGLTSMFRSIAGVVIIFNLRTMLMNKLNYKGYANRALTMIAAVAVMILLSIYGHTFFIYDVLSLIVSILVLVTYKKSDN